MHYTVVFAVFLTSLVLIVNGYSIDDSYFSHESTYLIPWQTTGMDEPDEITPMPTVGMDEPDEITPRPTVGTDKPYETNPTPNEKVYARVRRTGVIGLGGFTAGVTHGEDTQRYFGHQPTSPFYNRQVRPHTLDAAVVTPVGGIGASAGLVRTNRHFKK